MARISTKRKLLRASQTPHTVAEMMQHHMSEIAKLFDEPKLTLVVRSATLDMPLVVTNDQPEPTIAAIRQMVTVMAALNTVN
jgi:hypothetical protein